MLVEQHPLGLALDVDVVRGLLGAWRADPTSAGLAARRLALAMAREHLRAGHDVVVPQYVGRSQFVDELESLADAVAAQFHEVLLLDDKETALGRFRHRHASGDPVHRDAAHLVERGGGSPHLEEMYDRLVVFVGTRPRAVVVTPVDGDVGATCRAVLERLGLPHLT